MKTPITFPAEASAILESPGVTIESAFVNDGTKRSLVMVRRVVLDGSSPPAKPPAVVKYSERQYVLPHYHSVQLATPRFYRNYPGEDPGIRDENEASYTKSMNLQRFLERYRPQPSTLGVLPELGSAALTLARDDCWMFCASVRPTTAREARQVRRRFSEDYDCTTVIDDASEFARELGATFGTHLADADVRRGGLDVLASAGLPRELGERVVWVSHGHVVYTDDPAAMVQSYPEERRAAIVPFLKRSQYAYQREYRFVVATHGEPVEQVIRLPVSDDLRALTEMWDC